MFVAYAAAMKFEPTLKKKTFFLKINKVLFPVLNDETIDDMLLFLNEFISFNRKILRKKKQHLLTVVNV